MASEDTQSRPGDWDSILTLVLFVLSNVSVITPFRIPIPRIISSRGWNILTVLRIAPPNADRLKRRYHVPVNFVTMPLVSVLILLAAGAIDGTTVRRGIVGADGVKPLDIMALFISLAYISVSLDLTGLLRFSAFWVARKGGHAGRKLFLYLYVFFLVCAVIFGNDPVILCGTPFLAYLTRVSGITPPTAWIYTQFAAANMASVVLITSNPTNLVVSGAFSISFISYTAHVILPFLASSILTFPLLLYVLFRSPTLIPPSLNLPFSDDNNDNNEGEAERQNHDVLVDQQGAIFGSVLFVVTLAVLAGTSTVGVPVWAVTVPAAVIMLGRDVWHDWTYRRSMQRQGVRIGEGEEEHELPNRSSPTSPTPPVDDPQRTKTPSITINSERPRRHHYLSTWFTSHLTTLTTQYPTVTTVLKRLPTSVLPFAFLMFILIQGLSTKGWIEVFAGWWDVWVRKTGTLGAVGGMGFVACVLCNFCGTNIGATILLARVLQHWISTSSLSPTSPSSSPSPSHQRTIDGSIYALALGSNFGAFTLTIPASLAGLLWRQILKQKGIHIRQRQFALLNLPISGVAMGVACLVLVGEVWVLHRG
ncbi:hypothetical protein K474DRAFT_1596497 [Panus rudis PR-1116 ss-1]|nr:hypothetical protein K474DRAFT_1596497 [Panus rudis PR-1116 ss-1]